MIAVGKLARSEAGMTLVELLIATVVMSIGIAGIVAGFSSGIFTTVRAARASNAGGLADQQMENFRGQTWAAILTASTPMDATYTGDASAYDGTWKITGSCARTYCQTTRAVTVAGGSYRIDTYVKWRCIVSGSTLGGSVASPTCTTSGGISSRPVKLVTVVIRDGTTPSKTLFRESSSFDQTSAG